MPLTSALHRGDKCGQVFGKHYLRVDSLKFVCNLLGIEWCLSSVFKACYSHVLFGTVVLTLSVLSHSPYLCYFQL